jgi:hypothetical protein
MTLLSDKTRSVPANLPNAVTQSTEVFLIRERTDFYDWQGPLKWGPFQR